MFSRRREGFECIFHEARVDLRLFTVHCLHGSPCDEQSGAILGEKIEDQAEEACSFELAIEPCIICAMNKSPSSVCALG